MANTGSLRCAEAARAPGPTVMGPAPPDGTPPGPRVRDRRRGSAADGSRRPLKLRLRTDGSRRSPKREALAHFARRTWPAASLRRRASTYPASWKAVSSAVSAARASRRDPGSAAESAHTARAPSPRVGSTTGDGCRSHGGGSARLQRAAAGPPRAGRCVLRCGMKEPVDGRINHSERESRYSTLLIKDLCYSGARPTTRQLDSGVTNGRRLRHKEHVHHRHQGPARLGLPADDPLHRPLRQSD